MTEQHIFDSRIEGERRFESESASRAAALPAVRRIGLGDLRTALARGTADFWAKPTHLVFLGLIYALVGLVASRIALGYEAVLPLLFPMAAGFALVGPLAAIGLYELSRRREQGREAALVHALDAFRASRLRTVLALGALLLAIFFLWLAAAQAIYALTLGPAAPASGEAFLRDVFTTRAGWTMIVVGNGIGLLFAAVTLAVSVVSLPMAVDRRVPASVAVVTSIRAVAANPGPMAAWGLIVAALLVLGPRPLFVGLAVVVPILGHATWHLYRRVVAP